MKCVATIKYNYVYCMHTLGPAKKHCFIMDTTKVNFLSPFLRWWSLFARLEPQLYACNKLNLTAKPPSSSHFITFTSPRDSPFMSSDILFLQAIQQMSRHINGHLIIVQTPHLGRWKSPWVPRLTFCLYILFYAIRSKWTHDTMSTRSSLENQGMIQNHFHRISPNVAAYILFQPPPTNISKPSMACTSGHIAFTTRSTKFAASL